MSHDPASLLDRLDNVVRNLGVLVEHICTITCNALQSVCKSMLIDRLSLCQRLAIL